MIAAIGDRLLHRLYKALERAAPDPARRAVDGLRAARGHPHLIRHLDLARALVRHRRHPDHPLVGWILHGDATGGASRLHGVIPHELLRGLGVNSVLLRTPREEGTTAFDVRPADFERLRRCRLDVVCFTETFGGRAEALVRALREAGTRTVYVTVDYHAGNMPACVDWTVVSSREQRALAGPDARNVSVIESSVEPHPRLVKRHGRRDEVRVGWVGYPENMHLLEPVRAALRDPRLSRYRLVTISRGPDATYQWHPRRVWRHLLGCDIAVLPVAPAAPRPGQGPAWYPAGWYPSKPNTRMTMLKSLGLPIVATPIESYVATLRHGQSCLFAETVEEWADGLASLSDHVERERIGLAERDRVIATWGPAAIGQRWLALVQQRCGRPVPTGIARVTEPDR